MPCHTLALRCVFCVVSTVTLLANEKGFNEINLSKQQFGFNIKFFQNQRVTRRDDHPDNYRNYLSILPVILWPETIFQFSTFFLIHFDSTLIYFDSTLHGLCFPFYFTLPLLSFS